MVYRCFPIENRHDLGFRHVSPFSDKPMCGGDVETRVATVVLFCSRLQGHPFVEKLRIFWRIIPRIVGGHWAFEAQGDNLLRGLPNMWYSTSKNSSTPYDKETKWKFIKQLVVFWVTRSTPTRLSLKNLSTVHLGLDQKLLADAIWMERTKTPS